MSFYIEAFGNIVFESEAAAAAAKAFLVEGGWLKGAGGSNDVLCWAGSDRTIPKRGNELRLHTGLQNGLNVALDRIFEEWGGFVKTDEAELRAISFDGGCWLKELRGGELVLLSDDEMLDAVGCTESGYINLLDSGEMGRVYEIEDRARAWVAFK